MVNALEAGTIVALMAAVAGWFMVLRRQSFAGHTLAVMSFPGASAAALVGVSLSLGYFSFCVAGALAIAAGSRTAGRRNFGQESAVIGTVQVAGLALGFLFLSLYDGVLESLEELLFGSFLGITTTQVHTLAAITTACSSSSWSPGGRCSTAPSTRLQPPRAASPSGYFESRSSSCSAWRSQRPPRSPACCSSSRCSSLPRPQHSS